MKFICKTIEEKPYSEITSLDTLLKWSGLNIHDVNKLLEKSDTFDINGYRFVYLKTAEERQREKNQKYRKSLKKKGIRPTGDLIENAVEWEIGEKPTRVLYEIDGVVYPRREATRMIGVSEVTLTNMVAKYKEFYRDGLHVVLKPYFHRNKTMGLYRDGKLIMSGVAEEIATYANRTKSWVYLMLAEKKNVKGYEVKSIK